MREIQLELNIENKSSEELKFSKLEKQIDAMSESLGKIRRRLFSEIAELKKLCGELKKENEELRNLLNGEKYERMEWIYNAENGSLFDVREYQQATS